MGEDLCLSVLTVYEMDYSVEAANEALASKLEEAKNMVLDNFRLLPLTLRGSKNYGKLKSAYKSHSKAKSKAMKGHTIDIILAATALEHDAVLVSNDRIYLTLKELNPDLKVENWAEGNKDR